MQEGFTEQKTSAYVTDASRQERIIFHRVEEETAEVTAEE